MSAKHLAGGAIVVALLVGGALYLRDSASPVNTAGTPTASRDPVPTAAMAPPAPGATIAPAPVATKAPASPEDLALVARFEAWSAKSVEEARWLDQHGYPDAETAARYTQLSDDALAALAAEGDSLARLVQAERMAYRAPGPAAIDAMFDVAAEGSVYALERLALVHGSGIGADAGMMEAYLHAARLRGNYEAPITRDAAMGVEDRAMTYAMGQAILDRINQMRQQRGLPPLAHQPRPGAGITFEQIFIEWQARQSAPPAPPAP